MTVPTGLIAEFADIDLKDCNPGGAQREQADVIELRLEGGGQLVVLPSIFNCSVGEARGFCCPSRVSAIGFFLNMPRPVSEPITEIACVTHRHQASATVSIGRASDSVTADDLACAVDDREMRNVGVGFQYF